MFKLGSILKVRGMMVAASTSFLAVILSAIAPNVTGSKVLAFDCPAGTEELSGRCIDIPEMPEGRQPIPRLHIYKWEVMVYSPSSAVAAVAGSFNLRESATDAALLACNNRSGAGDCRVIYAAQERCIAAARAKTADRTMRVAQGATLDAAASEASKACSVVNPAHCAMLFLCPSDPPIVKSVQL